MAICPPMHDLRSGTDVQHAVQSAMSDLNAGPKPHDKVKHGRKELLEGVALAERKFKTEDPSRLTAGLPEGYADLQQEGLHPLKEFT